MAFSSNPLLSRPDIVTLRDDKRMITPDHIVPVVSTSLLKRYGPALRRPLNAASRLLSTLQLRGLNQQVIDGRLPEAVGGEFIDSNGLGGDPARRRAGPRIVVGFQDFAENETLAYMYAAALRGAGFRVTVRSAGGLRPQTVSALRSGRIGIWPAYSGSLLGYLGGRTLTRALARIGAQPLALAPAQDRNSFAMKSDVARALGVSKLSDLARYWPKVGASRTRMEHAAPDALQGEQWAVAPSSVLNLPGAWQLSQGAGVTVAVVDSGTKLDHPDLAPNAWTNFGEVPGNGADDDQNGLADDVHGVDLTTMAAQQDLSDGDGHGTHVAGIIAAAANGRGVVGVAPKAKIMTVRVLDANGAGLTGAVADGIRYAAANGARIINLSLQSAVPDARVNAAITAAAAANALVVVAAGNDGRDIDSQPVYPASVPAPNLIGVAATAPDDGRHIASFSNFGRLTVQLAAPGDDDPLHVQQRRLRRRVGHLDGRTDGLWRGRADGQRQPSPQRGRDASAAAAERDELKRAGRGRLRRCAALGPRRDDRGRLRHDPAAAAEGAPGGDQGRAHANPGRGARVGDRDQALRGEPRRQARGEAGRARLAVQRDDGEARSACAGPGAGCVGAHAGQRSAGGQRPDLRQERRVERGHGGDMRWAALLVAVAAAALAAAVPARAAPPITMSGAVVTRSLVADLAYFYRHAVNDPPRFSLVGGVSQSGIADAERGIVDAGMVARNLIPGDPADLVLTPVALSGMCVVTNRANPRTRRHARADPGRHRRPRDGLEPDAGLAAHRPDRSGRPRPDERHRGAAPVGVRRRRDAAGRPRRHARVRDPGARLRRADAGRARLPRPGARRPPACRGLRGGRLHAGDDQERHVPGACAPSASSPAASRAARSPASCAGRGPAPRRAR